MNNIVKAAFTRTMARTRPIYQYDYGMILVITGIDLPSAYEVHFGNSLMGNAVSVIGNSDGANIPDALLLSGDPIFAWLYLHTGADDGETVYVAEIPVIKRAKPTHEEPTPVQQSEITQAIAALNEAITVSSASAASAEQSAENAEQSAENAEQAYQNILLTGLAGTLSSSDDGAGNVSLYFNEGVE